MRKPNLFIVGEPKCGTTSLHSMLTQHPELFMSEKKELGYFGMNWDLMTEQMYMNHYKDVKDEKYIGDSSPFYARGKWSAERIKEFNPHAKIIFFYRNTFDWIVSYHKQMLRNPGHDVPLSTLKAIKYFGNDVNFLAHFHKYYDLFPKKNIMLIPYEDFKEHPYEVLTKMFRWLGIDTTFKPTMKKLNVTPKHHLIYYIYNKLPMVIKNATTR